MSEAKEVLEQAISRWNATDRDGWAALYADDVVYEAPGGQRISGLANLKEKYFDALVTAAPDRLSTDIVLIADGDYVVEQARYTGTHTVPCVVLRALRFRPRARSLTFPSSGSSGSKAARSGPSASTTTRSSSSRN